MFSLVCAKNIIIYYNIFMVFRLNCSTAVFFLYQPQPQHIMCLNHFSFKITFYLIYIGEILT